LSDHLGFSKEVGAFLAGFSLASTGYRDAIGSRLTSLRDFLLLFFFIALGARLDWETALFRSGASAIFSLFVLVGNPLIVVAIMGYMGYRRRTGLLAGLTVAQISEFSLIVAALGLSLGHIDRETMGLITLVGVVTIFFSTYMILYSAPLYRVLSRPLRIFERRNAYREASICYLEETPSVDFILVGLGNYGSELAEYLLRRNRSIVGVDFDPEVLERWRRPGLSMLYGDMEDPELLDHLPLKQARWVVSTVPSRDLNLALLENLRMRGFDGNVALTAADRDEAERYEKAGASIVFRPYLDAADQAAEALSYAVEILPERVRWPTTYREVAVRSDSTAAGREIRDLALRQTTGASILALRRAGQIYFDPEPDFRLDPGDRLVIVGSLEELKEAEANLNRFEQSKAPGNGERIEIAEIPIGAESDISGRSLADIRFRQTYGVTVIGIRRSEDEITTLNANTSLRNGDSLIVIGTSGSIDGLRRQAPL
jgi:Trk K+ transport system NAD-binding subunit